MKSRAARIARRGDYRMLESTSLMRAKRLRITLVVPGLLSLPSDVLARDAALARLAAMSTVEEVADLEQAILADVSLQQAAPAPLAALGAGVDVADRWVARADPVSIVVGREDARLHDVVDDLSEAERATLVGLLDTHFSADGLAFASPRSDAWFASMRVPQHVDFVPVRRTFDVPLRPLLPSGDDAARWRRWLTEAQMLLHEHPLAERPRPVNAIWFSGAGTLPPLQRASKFRAYAADGAAGDLVRGLARLHDERADRPARIADIVASSDRELVIVASNAVRSEEALAAVVRDHLEDALDAVDRSNVSSVKLIADGGEGAASWTVQRASWFARLRKHRTPFVSPSFVH